MTSPVFSLVTEDGERYAEFSDVDGFFSVGDGSGERRIRLADAAVDGLLLEFCLGRKAGKKVGAGAELRVLDASGRPIGAYYLAIARAVAAEAHGAGTFDVELDVITDGGHPHAEAWWRSWRLEPPRVKGLWAPHPTWVREGWMEVVRMYLRPPREDAPPGRTFELDGRDVTDIPGLYAALGEAVNGPGGYFGADLDALVDCLRGGFGALPPFTVVWRDSGVAAAALGKPRWGRDSLLGDASEPLEVEMSPFIDEVLEVLAAGRVTVVTD